MPRAAPIQTNFNAGELSPLVAGRITLDQYKTGLDTCLNWVPLVQGGKTRRPGTYYVTTTKTTNATRLQRFEFSTTQAYILEFGGLYMRVYRNHGQVQAGGGGTYELVTPYAAADVMALKFTQSADTLYVAHQGYAPQKITRTADNAWTITPIAFLDGPYLNINATATTLTASATSGVVTLTASSTTGINGGAGFGSGDIGRQVRILVGSTWGSGVITAVTSTTVCTLSVTSVLGGTTATTSWRLGVWSPGTGYPGAVSFFEDRLYWGGCTSYPMRIDGSNSGDYENMAPDDLKGNIGGSRAIAISLNASQVNVIRWMIDDERGLLVGTTGGEWIVKADNLGNAITPTNVGAKRSTKYGSANVAPEGVGKATLFVQRAGRKIREMAYTWQSDGFLAPDMTLLSEHITVGGITQMAYQQEPQSTVWMTRGDGALIGFVYNREQGVLGWSRHFLGGYSDAGQTVPAKVMSVACIPDPTGTRDELWAIVQRYINGATVQSIEYMTKIWEHSDAQASAFCVDMGLTYSGAPTTSVSGLGYLQGQTVAIWADGGIQPSQVVPPSGIIALSNSASTITIGLPYNSDGKIMRPEAGAADGTSQGKTRRENKVGMRLMDAIDLSSGRDFNNLYPLQFTLTDQLLGTATPLFTGDKSFQHEGDYDYDGYICWRVSSAAPATILAIMPQLKEEDNA